VIGSSPINTSGAATINITLDANITENIVATYNGDVSYASSASLPTVVTGEPATQFTLALNPSSVSIQSTQHIVIQVSAASINGFSDTLLYGCLGLPFAATCTFSSVQTSLASGGFSTVQLTIDTGDPLGAARWPASTDRGTPTFCCASCQDASSRVRSLPPSPSFVARSAASDRRCRGHSVGERCAGLQVNGTPAGSYTFKVTASGQGTGATESQVMNLTVTP